MLHVPCLLVRLGLKQHVSLGSDCIFTVYTIMYKSYDNLACILNHLLLAVSIRKSIIVSIKNSRIVQYLLDLTFELDL